MIERLKVKEIIFKLMMLKVLYASPTSVTLCVQTQSCSLAETGESFVRVCLHARVVHPR